MCISLCYKIVRVCNLYCPMFNAFQETIRFDLEFKRFRSLQLKILELVQKNINDKITEILIVFNLIVSLKTWYIHTEKSLLNLVKLNQIWFVITHFRQIINYTPNGIPFAAKSMGRV